MKSSPFTGRYLFHLHTTFTDGKLAVAEFFQFAQEKGIERLIFLEHIRRQPKYDVAAFAGAVREASEQYGVAATVGFEAKILEDGTLDIADEHLALADVLGIAEHGFAGDTAAMVTAFTKAIDSASNQVTEKDIVWVHPGLWFKKRQVLQELTGVYADMIGYALEQGVLVERNPRYDLLPGEFIEKLPRRRLVLGADAHSWDDLAVWLEAQL